MENYYQILGIPWDATQSEIKQAFRKLSMLYHPDRNQNKTPDKYKEIKQAYSVLVNPVKRSAYDKNENPERTEKEVAAADEITKYAIQLIEAENVGVSHDIVERIKETVEAKLVKLEAMLDEYRKRISRTETIAAKFKKRTEGKNIFRSALERRIDQLITDVEVLENQIATDKVALEILADYEYETIKLITHTHKPYCKGDK